MKKRILTLLLAAITILQIIPAFTLPIIAEGEKGISVKDMEVGKLYRAVWDYEYEQYTHLYKEDPEEPGSLIEATGRFLKNDLPQNLTVKLMEEGDFFLYITNEDWPATCYEYRYVDSYELIVLECLEPDQPEPDDGFVRGEVGLVMDGEVVTSLAIAQGEKTYVFTELSDKIEGTPIYQWQTLVDKEEDRWATILYYDAPYAALSESLLANSRDQETGMMTIRCIVTSGDIQYVSGTLNVGLSNEKATEVSGTIPPKSSSARAARRALAGSTARAGDGQIAEEAFQIEVSYVYWNNSPLDEVVRNLHGQSAADTFTVTLLPSVAYDGTKEHPIKPGYKAYVRDDSATENYIEYTALEDPNDLDSTQTHKYVEAEPIVFENEKVGKKVLVYYIPTEVNFRVNHYIQNLENDEYRLLHTDIKMGYSDYPVGENHEYTKAEQYADIAGFTDLFYDPNTRISASGNTEIDIYYDRNYYLVDFDLTLPDGQKGYGVMPLYVRYGTSLMLAEPVGPGFSFTGWTFDKVYNRIETVVDGQIHVDEDKIEDEAVIDMYDNPAAMLTIKHNVDYKSNWQAATVSYTIIYWRENANDNGFSIWTTEIATGNSGATVDVSGKRVPNGTSETTFFTYNEALSDTSVKIKGDGTAAANIYYTRNIYYMIFTATSNQGASTCRIATHTHGTNCCSVEGCKHTDPSKCKIELYCKLPEHTHVDACNYRQTCELVEHTEHINTCFTCGKEEHTVHTKNCYPNVGNAVNNNNPSGSEPSNPAEGRIYRYRKNNNSTYTYYIYINGQWYNYKGTTNNDNTVISATCGKALHTHSDSCCDNCTIHMHTDACYTSNCGLKNHSHSDGCYQACIRYEHQTHNGCSTYLYVLSAKYNADIAEDWPTADHVNTWRTAGWLNNNVYYSEWNRSGDRWATKRVDMTSELCNHTTNENKTYTLSLTSQNSAGKNTVKYMFESVEQTAGDGKVLAGGIYYEENTRYTQSEMVAASFGAKEILGMTNKSSGATLYYTRNSYTLMFMNDDVMEKSVSIKYEAPIAAQYFIPDVPSSYEANSVVFAGWYTTQMCADGTEFDFSSGIMPASNMYLYAKWEPTYWDVTVYQEEPKGDGEDKVLAEYKDVPFGTLLTALGGEPTRTAPVTGYIFAGWYYMDGDAEKRFDFNTMAVKHDYIIYAKWTSEVPVPYTVKYVTTIDGQEVEIADRTTGVSLAGISKSFTAKVDKDLYSGYQTGYFPESREMTYKMESEGNTITFSYSHDDDVEYAIRHVFTSPDLAKYTKDGSSTLELVWTQNVNSSSSALLTVSFRGLITKDAVTAKLEDMDYNTTAINNIWNEIITLSPDAYSKRLLLEAHTTAEDNEVVFHWEARTTKAVYEVHHYYESLTQEGVYEELSDPQRFEVIEGSNVEFDKLLIKGYQYSYYKTNHKNDDQITTVFKPTVGSDGKMGDGLIINVFYDRETYNYTIKFYDDELNTPIPKVDEIKTSAKYGTKITISDVAVPIEGYQLSNGSVVQELTYDNQEIICEYTRLSIKYEYIIDGVGGSFNNFQETVLFGDTPKAITLYLVDGYIIDGWSYSIDGATFEELTPAQATISADGKILQPVKPTVEYVGKTIYIKVKVVATRLTIQNSGSLDDEQGFIYVITNKTSGASVKVAVFGNTSTTVCGMPVGTYTVTLEDEWSWRYNTAIAVNDSGNTLSSNDNLSWEFSFDGNESIKVSYSDPNENYITDNSHN